MRPLASAGGPHCVPAAVDGSAAGPNAGLPARPDVDGLGVDRQRGPGEVDDVTVRLLVSSR
jgi:hypothetical protein